MGFFDKLKNGLGKTRNSFGDKINSVFSNFRKVDEELLEELEEILPKDCKQIRIEKDLNKGFDYRKITIQS